MEGWFTLLLFAVLFFVMMRYGCGAHMMHHNKHHNKSTEHESNDTDPVCGMKVDPDHAYSKTVNGKMWRFCSRSCLDSFEANPARFITDQSHDNGHGHHHAGGTS